MAALAGSVVVLMGGCGAPDGEPAPTTRASTPASPTATAAPTATATDDAAAQPVALDLDVPWGLALLPDGSALVSLRDRGEVVRVSPGTDPVALGAVPGVVPGGEGGLLGLAVPPDVADSGLVYAYLTAERDNRVVRLRLVGDALVPDAVVVDSIPKGSNHNGGRLAFGPDGYLYVTTGDAGDPAAAQDPDSLGGKILRVDGDGAVPPDNPDPSSPVFSLGHRNVQGLDWDAEGRLFASEFGQNTWDELNLVTPGGNYGWPVVEGTGGAGEGFVDPLVQWPTADASPSGLAVADGAVWLAALRGESLWRVPIEGGAAGSGDEAGDEVSVGEPERLLNGEYGRLRTVVRADDGRLWLLTSNTFRGDPRGGDDRLVVLDPADLS